MRQRGRFLIAASEKELFVCRSRRTKPAETLEPHKPVFAVGDQPAVIGSSASRFRFYEAEEVNVFASVAGDDQLESIGKCTAKHCVEVGFHDRHRIRTEILTNSVFWMTGSPDITRFPAI
jgi:hypothetical protein